MRTISIRKLILNVLGVAAIFSLGADPLLASTTSSSSVVLTLTSSPTIYFGQNVDGYAQVNSSDGELLTGTITFYDGSSAICVISTAANSTCPASAGANFPAGQHVVTAVYSGDVEHSGSTSNAVDVTVLQDSTATSISSTNRSLTYGQNVTFTATVQGTHGTPSGTARFFDGMNLLGTEVLTPNGTTTLSVSTLSPGTHAITAVYEGTPNSAPSTSAALNEVIQPSQSATTTTLTSSANPAITGQAITFTANVVKTPPSPQQPTGTVMFLDGDILLATEAIDNTGAATFNTSALVSGSHNITASYTGDTTAKASVSAAVIEVVSPSQLAVPSFTISASPVTVKVGQMASVTVKVTPVNGFNQLVQLGCTNLPSESSCTFGSPMVRIGGGSTTLLLSTMAPHDCGSSTSYYGSLPYSTPMAAALIMLLIPGKRPRRPMKGLLIILAAFCGLTAITGCGNCTDLGTRPGTYSINVIGTAQGPTPMTISQKITLKVVTY